MCPLPSNCDRDQKGVKKTGILTVLASGKNWNFNATVISARKNRPLFFTKPKLVQNTGLCGNSRLPAAQSRKPHDKANLKREESVSLKSEQRKKSRVFQLFFSFSLWDEQFVVGEHPGGLNFFPEKPQMASVSGLISASTLLFLSSSCQWLL